MVNCFISAGLSRNYSEDAVEEPEMMKESPLPQRNRPARPPRRNSLYGSRTLNNANSETEMVNGYEEMNGDVKDDKKMKRGRSPFRYDNQSYLISDSLTILLTVTCC